MQGNSIDFFFQIMFEIILLTAGFPQEFHSS